MWFLTIPSVSLIQIWSPINSCTTIVLTLCFTINKTLLQFYLTVKNLRFEANTKSILCIPQNLPLTQLECVICVFDWWCWCLWVWACSRSACTSPFHPIAKTMLFTSLLNPTSVCLTLFPSLYGNNPLTLYRSQAMFTTSLTCPHLHNFVLVLWLELCLQAGIQFVYQVMFCYFLGSHDMYIRRAVHVLGDASSFQR